MITAGDKALWIAAALVLVTIGVLLYRWSGARALQRWDQMPELVECPDCRKSGTMMWSRRRGKLVPVPRHKIFSHGNGKICRTCGGRGFVTQPGWQPSGEQSLADGPPMPPSQAGEGEDYTE